MGEGEKAMLKRITVIVILLSLPTVLPAQEEQQSAAELRQTWYVVAEMVASTGADVAAAEILESVSSLSDDELEFVYGNADLVGVIEVLGIIGDGLDAVDRAGTPGSTPVREVIAASWRAGPEYAMHIPDLADAQGTPRSTDGFPDATDYPPQWYCPNSPDRSDGTALQIAVDAIQYARISLEGAKGVWAGLSRGCDQTVVLAGEGGNSSVSCIPADLVLFAAELAVGSAEGVVEHFEFCDNGVDSAEIEGTYERVGHIHTDLATHDTNISTQLTTHDQDIKALLGEIQGTVDENQRLIKIFMSRQLEVLRLLITPEGRRQIDPAVLSCTGDDCPQALECSKGGLAWPCK
jgi:hypothetical protein